MFRVQDSSVCKVGTPQLLCRDGRTSIHGSNFRRSSMGFFPVTSKLTAGMYGEGEGTPDRSPGFWSQVGNQWATQSQSYNYSKK